MSLVQGSVTDRFTGVREVLEANLSSGGDLGASVAIYFQGRLVADLWGGFLDEQRTVAWQHDTIVNVWSTTKTMTFLVALMLCDRGQLDFFAPVAKYWPEFAEHGKGDIEVRHLMSHGAGLSGWSEHLEAEDLADWERCTSALARQSPWWQPGTRSGYHALTQGYLIGELVRRITGTTIGQFFKREVADVIGADFFIGLPESEEARVAPIVPPASIDLSTLPSDSVAYRTYTSPPLDPTMPWERWWRAAEIPAANGHGNARSVAMIQSIIANNGEFEGHRFFRREIGDLIFLTQTHGIDLVLGVDMHFGMGYGLSSATAPMGPRGCFWGGFGGSVIVMDQDTDLTVAYVMNQMRVGLIGDTRGPAIVLAAALGAALD
ncbi:MAG TPA: serine hydrolase domain-containing protein [Acidimicrobiales bacterium]|nr:serine hydrolase domain-containing protein [Acidimicrobiales bacterium]